MREGSTGDSGVMNQKLVNLRLSVQRLVLRSWAYRFRLSGPVMWSMKSLKSAAAVMSGLRLVVEELQFLHRHRVVPLLVFPFFFIGPWHTEQVG